MLIPIMLVFSCAAPTKIQTQVIPLQTPKLNQPTLKLPNEPKLYKIQWTKINNNYCVDEANAKKLIYNIDMLKTYNKLLKIDYKLQFETQKNKKN